MPTLVNNLRAIRGPVTAVPMVGASGVIVEPDTVNNQVVVRADETVLWEGECNWWTADVISNGLDVSEDFSNFEYIKVLSRDDWQLREHWTEFRSKPTGNQFTIAHVGPEGGKLTFKTGLFNLSGHHISIDSGCMMNVSSAGAHNYDFSKAYIQFLKIVGINRKANA